MNTREVLQLIKDRVQGKAPKGSRRSSGWSVLRDTHLKMNPECEVCGRKTKVEVHHIIPFHVAPDKELDPANLISLCESKKNGINCHLLIGHLGNYKRFNPSTKADALYWRAKLGNLDLDDNL